MCAGVVCTWVLRGLNVVRMWVGLWSGWHVVGYPADCPADYPADCLADLPGWPVGDPGRAVCTH